MKKNLLTGLMILFSFSAAAQTSAPSEAGQFGIAAGIALRCRAGKALYKYEEIISRYFANTAPNATVEKNMLTEYARAKAGSFMIDGRRNTTCAEDLRNFENMPLMKFELYSDGSLKTTDGKWLFPRGQKKLSPDAVRVY